MLPVYEQKGNREYMSWETMDNPPKENGHYCVCHSGRVFGTAYYHTGEKNLNIPVGWSQIPTLRPTHWLNSSYDISKKGIVYERFETDRPFEKIGPSFNELQHSFKRIGFFRRLKMAFTGKLKK